MRKLAEGCIGFSAAAALSVLFFPLWMILIAIAPVLCGGVYLTLNRRKRAGAVCFAMLIGFCLCGAVRINLEVNALRVDGTETELTLCVTGEQDARTALGKVESEGPLKGKYLKVYGDFPAALSVGNRLHGTFRIKVPTYRRERLYAQNVFYIAYGSDLQISLGEIPISLSPKYWAESIGRRCTDRFGATEGGLICALMTGNRANLSEEINDALRLSGLSHLAAASGLHLNLLFSMLWLIPGRQRRKSVILLLAVWLYAALAGFTPSICRAAVMQSLILLGYALERESDDVTALSLALALILCRNPYAICGVGLQLSFAATAGILFLTPRIQGLWREERQNTLVQAVAVSFSAWIATLPLVLLHFGSAAVLAPVWSVAVSWLLPVLIPMALIALLLGGCFPAAAVLPTTLSKALAGTLTGLLNRIAGGRNPRLYSGDASVTVWVLLCCGVILVLVLGHGGRRRTVISCVLLAASLLMTLSGNQPSVQTGAGSLRVSGDGALITLSQGGTLRELAADTLLTPGCPAQQTEEFEPLFIETAGGTILLTGAVLPERPPDTPVRIWIVGNGGEWGEQESALLASLSPEAVVLCGETEYELRQALACCNESDSRVYALPCTGEVVLNWRELG